jgi:hypothetical protein
MIHLDLFLRGCVFIESDYVNARVVFLFLKDCHWKTVVHCTHGR